MSNGVRAATVAWLITAVYYFYQYALRSAPAVMMPQLSDAFGMTAMGVASLAGLFYYGYSPFSLVAGVAMDRLGARRVVPIGAAAVGIGALMFATGNNQVASVGRLLQGAGGVFALVGAVYIATTSFPPSRAATLIGATQMFGMAGGSAGQFVVGPIIASGVAWDSSSFCPKMRRRSRPADSSATPPARSRSSSAIPSQFCAASSPACCSSPRPSSTWCGVSVTCRRRAASITARP